ncbi:DUF397 domain-containing protein [Saccharopolyspora sp. MS10]|uniref:DUF397 domain-containing protein n=1 Tax=Saccharopolyspora sp. MS10 TaxID=3385973 RepID=UPI0039A15515
MQHEEFGALAWRKSSYSSSVEKCVEVARFEHAVAARDSKDPGGGVLVVSAASWNSFLRGISAGRFDG